MFRSLCIAVVCLAMASGEGRATVTAHFQCTQDNGRLRRGEHRSVSRRDPELYFRQAVFDASSSSIFNACANDCSSDDGVPATLDGLTFDYCSWVEGCGTWDFPNQTLSKVIPDASGAYFYFGLWDEDNDEDDSMGDHWFYAAAPVSLSDWNNNVSPYYADNPIANTCFARDVEGHRRGEQLPALRFRLVHR